MAQEKEIKINLKISPDEFIDRIQKKGFGLKHTLKQTDIYFDTPDWFLYENIAALRLRQIDNIDYSFSFKKVFYFPNNSDHYYVEEIETKFPLNDFYKLKEILSRINIPYKENISENGIKLTQYLSANKYYDEQRMPKIRRVFSKGEDEITIDDVKNVGIIIELECAKNNPHYLIKTLLKENEWERSVEGTSYIWLKNVKGKTSHLENLEKFKTRPDWNVWENEKEMYKKLAGQLTF